MPLVSNEILLAVVLLAVPAAFIALMAFAGNIFFEGLLRVLTPKIIKTVAKDLEQFKVDTQVDIKMIYNDTQHLRNNGTQTRNRLDQSARETEAIRDDVRDLGRRVTSLEITRG